MDCRQVESHDDRQAKKLRDAVHNCARIATDHAEYNAIVDLIDNRINGQRWFGVRQKCWLPNQIDYYLEQMQV